MPFAYFKGLIMVKKNNNNNNNNNNNLDLYNTFQ